MRLYRFFIENNIKEPGTTVAKLFRSGKNQPANNFGNVAGITISYGYPDKTYEQFLAEPAFRATRIEIEVQGSGTLRCPDGIAWRWYKFGKEEKCLAMPLDIIGLSGESEIDLKIGPNVELEIKTGNDTITIVSLYHREPKTRLKPN